MSHGETMLMTKTEELLCDSRSRFELYAACYFHPRPRGLVVLAHSLQQRTGDYENLVRLLWNAQFSVYLYNWRRQEKSVIDNPSLVYVASANELLEDLKLTLGQASSRAHHQKVFVIGHDIGGAIAALLCASLSENEVAGITLFAPMMIPPTAPNCIGSLTPLASVLLPWTKMTVERKGTIDEMFVRTYQSCTQLVHKLKSKRSELKIPLLVLYGTEDSSDEVESSRLLFVEASSSDKKLMAFEGTSDDLWSNIAVNPKASSILITWLQERSTL